MMSRQATAGDATLDVHVTLVTTGAPIANAPIRLVLGSAPGWDASGAGITFTTDAKGEYHFTTMASLDLQKLKVPTNFFTQLVSRARRGSERSIHGWCARRGATSLAAKNPRALTTRNTLSSRTFVPMKFLPIVHARPIFCA